MNEFRHTYGWVMAHMGESCHTYEWKFFRIFLMIRVTHSVLRLMHTHSVSHIWMNIKRAVIRVTWLFLDDSCHKGGSRLNVYEWDCVTQLIHTYSVSHIWMNIKRIRMNIVMSHIWMNMLQHFFDDSCYTYEGVISHTWMSYAHVRTSRVTHMNA